MITGAIIDGLSFNVCFVAGTSSIILGSFEWAAELLLLGGIVLRSDLYRPCAWQARPASQMMLPESNVLSFFVPHFDAAVMGHDEVVAQIVHKVCDLRKTFTLHDIEGAKQCLFGKSLTSGARSRLLHKGNVQMRQQRIENFALRVAVKKLISCRISSRWITIIPFRVEFFLNYFCQLGMTVSIYWGDKHIYHELLLPCLSTLFEFCSWPFFLALELEKVVDFSRQNCARLPFAFKTVTQLTLA
ncbi:MAG: hypothetical protein RR224_11875 [Clostridia bacterium]